jgi:O-antigen/teichoic acid export membrane protein
VTLRVLGTNSAIYAATTLVQKGAAFLLMPLYTLYLEPAAFGVIAIVTAVNGFLTIAFTLGLTGAVTRFYFEYQEQPEQLAEFWGSVLTLVIVMSTLLAGALLLIGEHLLRPVLGGVPFWPYVALGVVATFFQPFITTFLSVLQARNQPGRYALVSLSNFALMTLLTIAFVVFLGWGVSGALLATLLAAAVFFCVALFMMRSELRFSLRWRHLRLALSYSLPTVPHSVASQTTAMSDRMILNSYLGTAVAGLYSVGAMIAMGVEVAAYSVSRAYLPLSMGALQSRDPVALAELRAMGSVIVATFCLLGAGVGTFGAEVVRLLTAPAFQGAAVVVPLLAFSCVASAIYYVLVNILFFDRSAIKLLPVCTLSGAVLSVCLSLLLIPVLGLLGAALGNLLAQTLVTILVAFVGRRFDPVDWQYARYLAAFLLSFALSWWLSALDAGTWVVTMFCKFCGLAALLPGLGLLLWNRPLILPLAILRLLDRRPAEAAALFIRPNPAT